MNSDINVPQSKTITIVFAVMRLSLLLFNSEQVAGWWLELPGRCSTSFRSYYNSVKMLATAMLGVSTFMLLLMVCSTVFRRLLFYLYYALVVVMTGYLMVASALIVNNREACQSVTALGHMTLFTCIGINLLVLCVIALPFELAMKAVNLGGCIIWPVFLFAYQQLLQKDCTSYHLQPWTTTFASLIAWSHLAILIIGYFIFTVLKLTVKSTFTAKIWRSIMLASVILMIMCFAVAWLERFYDPSNLAVEGPCTYQRFFLRVYQRHGWVEFIAPILLMTFMRLENGDVVRENDLKYTWGYPQPFVAPPL
jgi:hypothetical protein